MSSTQRTVVAVCAVVGSVAPACGAGSAQAARLRCDIKATTVAVSAKIRVFTRQRTGTPNKRDLYACERPRGGARRVFTAAGVGTYNSLAIIDDRFVGLTDQHPDRDKIVQWTLRILDVRSGRYPVSVRHSSSPAPAAADVAMLHGGSAAYIQRDVDPEDRDPVSPATLFLVPRGSHLPDAERKLDFNATGALGDLAASPSTLFWLNAGSAHSSAY